MTKEIEQIQQYIGKLAVGSAPEKWNSIEVISRNIWSYAELDTYFFIEGRDKPLQTGIEDDDLPEEDTMIRKFELLRKHMYALSPDNGAWYTGKLIISNDGTFEFTFDYDNKPSWDYEPMEEEYANDLKNFPRKADSLPQWLKPVVKKFGSKYQLK